MTQDLLPKLPVWTVIVMDNAAFHKRADNLENIRRAACVAEFLPPYSTDFNPIEHTWAQLKSIRHTMTCSIDELFSPSTIGHLFILL